MSKPRSPLFHWQLLRDWMNQELAPQALQEGCSDVWESIQALDQHFRGLKTQRATSNDADVLMRSCCDRFKNEDHHPDCAIT